MNKMPKKRYVLLVYLVLALVTLIAFERMRLHDFIDFDALDYVENEYIQHGLTFDNIVWAFTTPHAANWHPLTWISHMLDWQFFGSEPGWHHLHSVFIHIANTLVLFFVLNSMTGTFWRSFFVAAVFALHPLHVESVAWVSERKDVLSGFFWMLTLAAYIRYVERPKVGTYIPVLASLCLGLMAKPMLVTLPFVLLLLDYWPLHRFSLQSKTNHAAMPVYRLIAEKVPLFIMVAISSVVTFAVQQGAGAVQMGPGWPLNVRLNNALAAYAGYIGKTIYPSNLAVFYPHPGSSPGMWQPIVCGLLLVAVSAGVIYAAHRYRYLIVGWLWFIGTLIPVIGLVQVGSQAMADRYTYLPSIGIFIIVAWGAEQLCCKWRYLRVMSSVAGGVILVVLLICTRVQVNLWQNSISLFVHTVNVTEDNYVIHNNLGTVLVGKNQLPDAVNHYQKALQANPDYARAHYNLGVVLQSESKLTEATERFSRAIELDPEFAKAHNWLGMMLYSQGKVKDAIRHYLEALRIEPNHARAHNNLGNALREQGKVDEAIEQFRLAVQYEPDTYEIRTNLADILKSQGELAEAIRHYKEALRIKPNLSQVHNELGNIYHSRGELRSAVEHWTETVNMESDSLGALNNLAWVLATCDEPKFRNPIRAITFAEKACKLTDYKQPGWLDTLAAAYAAADRFDEATKTAETALKLAEAANQQQLAEEIQKRLESYYGGRPWRQPPATEGNADP